MGLLLIGAAGGCGRSTPADLVLHNGLILTLDERDGGTGQAVKWPRGGSRGERAILNKYSAAREVDPQSSGGQVDGCPCPFVIRQSWPMDPSAPLPLRRCSANPHAERQPEGWVLGQLGPERLKGGASSGSPGWTPCFSIARLLSRVTAAVGQRGGLAWVHAGDADFRGRIAPHGIGESGSSYVDSLSLGAGARQPNWPR